MPLIHIATDESFLAGGLDFESCTCSVCYQKGRMTFGYVVAKCHTCDTTYDPDCFSGYFVEKRRMLIGLTRKQYAPLLGVKAKTLRNAETSYCSRRIHEKSIALIKDFMTVKLGIVQGQALQPNDNKAV